MIIKRAGNFEKAKKQLIIDLFENKMQKDPAVLDRERAIVYLRKLVSCILEGTPPEAVGGDFDARYGAFFQVSETNIRYCIKEIKISPRENLCKQQGLKFAFDEQ